ncbi:zinc finger HIT domain-containing protein 2 [Teleopsis dalmanni]|uniref:zinc finger HIT domain-containing protein 2 n=1 Tax=Teleopsis dalmanni TaxID=139649 RepID=UPI0018CCD57B|nr:zinc finger HIT domain-containing protein 2 [Teleopsis dalmanni]
MSNNIENCQLCNKSPYKYVCPKCNVPYCSVDCYKSNAHLKCSEQFYKTCIRDELTSAQPQTPADMRKIYDILKRMHEFDAGVGPKDFDDGLAEPLDSDDDEPHQSDNDNDEEEENGDDDDLATRLQDIDINDADAVWECLTTAEQKEFQKMITNGEIMKLLPDYKPWWQVEKQKLKKPKIVVLEPKENKSEEQPTLIPTVKSVIPKFSVLCSKEPSPCLHYNLWNILGAYACTVRFFSGEHITNPTEAASNLVNLSATLKYGTNFEEVNDALISVEMEALTTGNGANGPNGINSLLVESREQLENDAKELMCTRQFKLAAFSDMLNLFLLTKKQLKTKNSEEAEFQKLYAMCSGNVELSRTKLQQFIKKFEFYLSYVNRDAEEDLK